MSLLVKGLHTNYPIAALLVLFVEFRLPSLSAVIESGKLHRSDVSGSLSHCLDKLSPNNCKDVCIPPSFILYTKDCEPKCLNAASQDSSGRGNP